MALDKAAKRYLASQTRGRLATIGSDGVPQNKPVGFTYNAELGTIDIAGFNMDNSAKYRNVGINSNVAFVVDDAVSEGAAGMRFAEIRVGRVVSALVDVPKTAPGVGPESVGVDVVDQWPDAIGRPGPALLDRDRPKSLDPSAPRRKKVVCTRVYRIECSSRCEDHDYTKR